jgi:glycosyltransferase involved in cell wall biosynthesis
MQISQQQSLTFERTILRLWLPYMPGAVRALSEDPRILFFVPDTGGTGVDGPLINAVNLAQSFRDADYPAIFVYNGRREAFDRFIATGADVRRADFPIGSWKTHLNPFYRRKYSRKLARFIEDERIDVVYMFMRGTYLMSYMKGSEVLRVSEQLYASGELRPIRLFDNGFTFRPRAILSAWYRKYVRFNHDKSDLVVTMSNAQNLAATVKFGIPESKTVVVPPGVTRQAQHTECGLVRRELGIPTSTKVILSVGRITPAKGVEEFGEIARLLAERGKSYRFLFAGYAIEPEYESEMQRRFGQYVTFLGHRSDIPNCLIDADLYLHPSHREGLPLAIIESMEFGLPTVAWDIPGCDELITDGENGSLVKFGDIDSAADEIERYLENQEIYDRASNAAKQRFIDNHENADYSRRVIDNFNKAIAAKARR